MTIMYPVDSSECCGWWMVCDESILHTEWSLRWSRLSSGAYYADWLHLRGWIMWDSTASKQGNNKRSQVDVRVHAKRYDQHNHPTAPATLSRFLSVLFSFLPFSLYRTELCFSVCYVWLWKGVVYEGKSSTNGEREWSPGVLSLHDVDRERMRQETDSLYIYM